MGREWGGGNVVEGRQGPSHAQDGCVCLGRGRMGGENSNALYAFERERESEQEEVEQAAAL